MKLPDAFVYGVSVLAVIGLVMASGTGGCGLSWPAALVYLAGIMVCGAIALSLVAKQ